MAAKKKVAVSTNPNVGNHDDPEYDAFLRRIQARFLINTGQGKVPLFTTNAEGLFAAYLSAIPTSDRQYHTCHACQQFVDRFGGLVTIDPGSGIPTSAVWDVADAPDYYVPAIEAMLKRIRRAKVTGVFLSSESIWGQPVTGIWTHLAVKPSSLSVYRKVLLTAGQAMAEKKEDFKAMITALKEFPLPVVTQAVTLLKTESLYRSEKCLGVAEWFARLHKARTLVRGSAASSNLLWLAVAQAPPGFCHVRSSMIGTLLEDLAAGLPFNDVNRKFAEKMHPLQYQRPQAAPTEGNIAQAEKLVEQLGITNSLRRRYARLEEIDAIWFPKEVTRASKSGGVFGHLKSKSAGPEVGGQDVPAVTMTWEKFSRTVLPEAQGIEFYVPGGVRESFTALVTAVDPEAPPILQWDSHEHRNPFSWYFWSGGSPATQWGLRPNSYVKVNAVTPLPSMWDETPHEHQGKGVIFILEGARDSRDAGLALFPEILKSELRAVRSTIEAFSKAGEMEGGEEASACGIALQKGHNWSAMFRVRTADSVVVYKLDRWD